ncbi:MAG: hypothetical protein ACOX2L_04020 [Anaerolineae bacterium]|nr:hypothetical protein [Chloroflexota bacterium]
MSTLGMLVIGLLLGAGGMWLHLQQLGTVLAQAERKGGSTAHLQVLKRAPLRLAPWLVLLAAGVHLGMAACLGLVLGMVAARTLLIARFTSSSQGRAGGY